MILNNVLATADAEEMAALRSIEETLRGFVERFKVPPEWHRRRQLCANGTAGDAPALAAKNCALNCPARSSSADATTAASLRQRPASRHGNLWQ